MHVMHFSQFQLLFSLDAPITPFLFVEWVEEGLLCVNAFFFFNSVV